MKCVQYDNSQWNVRCCAVNEATPGVAIPPSVTVLATCLEQHWTFPSGRWRPLFNWNYSMYHRICTRFCYIWSWDYIGFCAYFMSVQHSFMYLFTYTRIQTYCTYQALTVIVTHSNCIVVYQQCFYRNQNNMKTYMTYTWQHTGNHISFSTKKKYNYQCWHFYF